MLKRISFFMILIAISLLSVKAQEPQVREFYNQGMEEFKKGNFDSAIRFFSEAIKKDSDYYQAFSGRGLAYLRKRPTSPEAKKQLYQTALDDFSTAINLNPVWSGGYINRSSAYSLANEYEKALNDLQKAEEIDPKNPYIFAARGDVFMKLENYQSALESFTNAIKIKPLSAFYTNRCFSNFKLEKYETAILDCSESTTLNPQDNRAYYFRALVRLKLEQKALAISDLRKCLEINPKYILAKTKLEELLKDNKY